jgi:riboflavin kinase/FMN adenylyltransferase
MEVYYGLDQVDIKGKGSAVTVGTFDGLHNGHQKILNELKEKAAAFDLVPTMVTFEPHPKAVLRDTRRIRVLTTLPEKLDVLRALGIGRVVIITFTPEFSQMHYSQFVREVLIEKIKARAIVFGYDHAFGKNREGTFKELQKLSENLNFKVCEVGPLSLDEGVVSSTRIRSLIADGDVVLAAKMLGRAYTVIGKVVAGDGRGKLLGFPTANIDPGDENKLYPGDGVYAVDCLVGSKTYRGMANIGYKPTFGLHDRCLEVNLFDFNREIYGEEITLGFLKRLRDEQKFASKEALMRQLEQDKIKSIDI